MSAAYVSWCEVCVAALPSPRPLDRFPLCSMRLGSSLIPFMFIPHLTTVLARARCPLTVMVFRIWLEWLSRAAVAHAAKKNNRKGQKPK